MEFVVCCSWYKSYGWVMGFIDLGIGLVDWWRRGLCRS